MREVAKTKVLDFRGLSLLMVLCLTMLAQRKVSIVIWFILGLVCLHCFFKWRQGILLVFIWLNVEGFLRLWTGGSITVFFFKDIMLFTIYMSFLFEKFFFREKPPIPHSVTFPLICLFGLSLIQLLNPNLHSALVGFMGLQTLFFYVPLFYISFQLFDSKDSLLQFCFILMLMAIPVCLYGLIQFLQGPDYYRSLGEAFQPWIVFGERATSFSPPSTFIFVSNFGSYLLFMTFFGIGLINARLAGYKKLMCWISFISILVALVITTRRLTVVLVAIGVPTMLLLQKRMKPFVYFIIVSLSIIFIAIYFIPGVSDLFFGRILYVLAHPYEAIYSERILGGLHLHMPLLLSSAFVGNGIGMGSLGRRYIWTAGGAPMEGVESQYVKIWYELSIWGFLIFVWLLVRLVRTSWHVYRGLDDPDLKWITLGIFTYQCAVIGAGTITNILDIPINAVYLWFFSGVLFKLPLFAAKQLQPQES